MHDPSCPIHILKMKEPVLSCHGIDPCALMRSVYRAAALTHDNLIFVRSKRMLCPQYGLPSGLYASRRSKHVIPAVTFIHFRSLDRDLIVFISIKDLYLFTDQPHSIRLHLYHMQYALISDPALCHTCDKICLSVVIPERTGIDPACSRADIDRCTPFSKRIFCRTHINTLIRHWETNVKCSFMISYGRCPHAASVHWSVVTLRRDLW